MFAHIPDQPSVIPDSIGDPCSPGFPGVAGNDGPRAGMTGGVEMTVSGRPTSPPEDS